MIIIAELEFLKKNIHTIKSKGSSILDAIKHIYNTHGEILPNDEKAKIRELEKNNDLQGIVEIIDKLIKYLKAKLKNKNNNKHQQPSTHVPKPPGGGGR